MKDKFDRDYALKLYNSKKYKEHFEYCMEYAQEGNADAQNMVGVCYRYGDGVPADLGKSVEWYSKSAAQGFCVAQYNLGMQFLNGLGVPQDKQNAIVWFTKAAEQYAKAQCYLGMCYEKGIDVEANDEKAFELYLKAAKQHYVRAMCAVGRCYYYGRGVENNYYKAVEWFQKAADKNNAEAQYFLGWCYWQGNGVEISKQKAVEWYTKSAERGNAKAQMNLGACYHQGVGIEKNETKAVEWYTKSAEQGNASAQNNLGVCYECGVGVEKNMTKAVEWYTKSAEQGSASAQNNLGICYSEGVVVEKNATKAVEWYTKSAEQGDGAGQCNLGYQYERGIGVEKNEIKAVEWYTKSAKQGVVEAQYHLGVCCECGIGVKKNEPKAVEWYTKSAEQGFPLAQFSLGLCYYYGRGVNRDYNKAVKWFQRAARENNAEALCFLGKCYIQGTGVKQDDKSAVRLYEMAANLGNIEAKRNLGWSYGCGRGVPQDTEKAIKLLNEAAKLGDKTARVFLDTVLKAAEAAEKGIKNEALKNSDTHTSSPCSDDVYYRPVENSDKPKEESQLSTGNDESKTELWAGDIDSLLNKFAQGRDEPPQKEDKTQNKAVSKTASHVEKTEKSTEESKSTNISVDSESKSAEDIDALLRKFNQGRWSEEDNHPRQETPKSNPQADDTAKPEEEPKSLTPNNDWFGASSSVDDIGDLLRKFDQGRWLEEDNQPRQKNPKSKPQADNIAKPKEELNPLPQDSEPEESSTVKDIDDLLRKFNQRYDGIWAGKEKESSTTSTPNEDISNSVEEMQASNDVEQPESETALEKAESQTNIGLFTESPTNITEKLEKELQTEYEVKQSEDDMFPNDAMFNATNGVEHAEYHLKNDDEYVRKSDLNKLFVDLCRFWSERDEDTRKEIMGGIEGLQTSVDIANEGIDTINDKLDNLTDYIQNKMFGEIEKMRKDIIGALDEHDKKFEEKAAQFISETSNKLNEQIAMQSDDLLTQTEEKLKTYFGEFFWKSMQNDTRLSLKSAHLLWNNCRNLSGDFDYSGVVICATAALENELRYWLFDMFKKNMPNEDYSTWPLQLTYFDKNSGKCIENKSDHFNMGMVPRLFGQTSKGDPQDVKADVRHLESEREKFLAKIMKPIPKDKANIIRTYSDYFMKKIFDDLPDTNLEIKYYHVFEDGSLLAHFEYIRNTYRNKAAHAAKIEKAAAEECCSRIIGKEVAAGKIEAIDSVLRKLFELISEDTLKTLSDE